VSDEKVTIASFQFVVNSCFAKKILTEGLIASLIFIVM